MTDQLAQTAGETTDRAAPRPLVDLARLERWMDGQGLAAGPVSEVQRLTGGTQNLILRFKRGANMFVMRRPPIHPRPGNDEVMRREARLLGALAATNVPHPKLVAACRDPEVMGYAFYLMQEVDGFSPQLGMPGMHAGSPRIRHSMGLSAVDALARLGRIDPHAVGLSDFGRPEGFLERQVKRWSDHFAAYAAVAEWPGASVLPGIAAVAHWLDAHRPPSFVPGIMHGDFHLGNLMYRHDGPDVAAIVDWEMATIGDPLVDLGWLLATWPQANGVGVIRITPGDGFPSEAEILAHYASVAARPISDMDWYFIFACFKLAIVLEGTHVRACAHQADAELGRRLNESAGSLIRRAVARIEARRETAS